MPDLLLEVTGLTSGYGDVQVLWGIDIGVRAGGIACVVGANGAGKSTLLRTLAGLVRARSGSVRFAGRDLTGSAPDIVLGAGVTLVPEGRRLFKGLSVRDNLLLGAYLRRAPKGEIEADLERVYGRFPILAERRHQDATTLSGGEQQMCAIGRGLMARPRLLMIDELSLGLAPRAVDLLLESLAQVNGDGVSILLVEQDVLTAFDFADQAFVIETGRVVASGASAVLAEDPRIRQAYLGL